MADYNLYRITYNKNWKSTWYTSNSKEYSKYLMNDLSIRNIINDFLKTSIVSNINIEIIPDSNNVIANITCGKFGIAIGKKGSNIEKLKSIIFNKTKLNIKINLKEENNSSTNPIIIANNVADFESKGVNIKRVMYKLAVLCFKSGVAGVRIKLKGRINGTQIARKELVHIGKLNRNTITSNLDYYQTSVQNKYGICGIKVWVCKN